MEVPSNPSAPHRAVIFIEATVHERMPNGDCHAHHVTKINKLPLVIDGPDRFIVERKLNELIAELKERCTPKK